MVLRGKCSCLQTALSNNLRYSLRVHTSFLMRQKRKPWLDASEAVESKNASALYVGIAYWVGYGVEQSMEESLSWISRSANQGSPAASLILEILENPRSRHNLILSNFKISFEGQGCFSRQANCRFGHQSSEASEISSFSSIDGCNPLHYL